MRLSSVLGTMLGNVEMSGNSRNVKGGVIVSKKINSLKKANVELSYVAERERKEKRKASKSWRDMRKRHIEAKRFHDRTTPEDGRMLEGYGLGKDDGYGLGEEGWDL